MTIKLHLVTFQPHGKTVEVTEEVSVLEVAIANEIPLEGPCNGKGYCGKCYVKCFGDLSEPSEKEKKFLGTKLKEGWRCRAFRS